jgi:hypothetical protein
VRGYVAIRVPVDATINTGKALLIMRTGLWWPADSKPCPGICNIVAPYPTELAEGQSVEFDAAPGSTDKCRLACNVRAL